MNHNHIIYTVSSKFRFNLTKAEGSSLWDDKGKEYIDFTSGWNVTNLGWNNPEIIEVGIAQFKKNTYVPMWAMDGTQEKYSDLLLKSIGNEYTRVARATGGMEAIEMAIKTARAYTGKMKILSFYEQYHGGSINALSLSYRKERLVKLTDSLDNFVKLEYPNTYRTELSPEELLINLEKELEEKLSSNEFACVVTEAGIITGWGSTYVAPNGFIELIDKICKKYGVLLILDEVGTGFSRTGDLFAMHRYKISPDIIVLAKAIANGSQTIATMVTKEKIYQDSYQDSKLQSTFGWNPIACAVALKTLEIHLRDKVWTTARDKGNRMVKHLKHELGEIDFVGDIRGLGMEIGLDLVTDKKSKTKNSILANKVVADCTELGLHIVGDHEGFIQLMPPLTIDENVLEKGLEILINSIKKNI